MIYGGLSGMRGTECTWGLNFEKKSVSVVSAELNHTCECRSQRSTLVSPGLIYILFWDTVSSMSPGPQHPAHWGQSYKLPGSAFYKDAWDPLSSSCLPMEPSPQPPNLIIYLLIYSFASSFFYHAPRQVEELPEYALMWYDCHVWDLWGHSCNSKCEVYKESCKDSRRVCIW